MSTIDQSEGDDVSGPAAAGPRAGGRHRDHRRTAWTLGLFGLVPFVVMTALLVYAGRNFIAYPQLILAFGGYSATILAFLGGIRWGFSLAPQHQAIGTLVAAVLPSLLGWALLFAPSPWSFAGFAAGFALTGLWDVVSARRGELPAWFGRLRLVLASVVTLCQIAAFASTWG
ncbi:DUF3429 domain-containing protein [Jiella sonneratiae]|uniref:DUF3429 domain-containing protein n=1 Tax=Jiella sonneratiae TaxID=2816856 RepID=A0ABS3J546_9HYPH|nr:DUF3429 domain-containing protein [Jiella sonneratiae]MBO0904207.1 DUF3429 domain-containing protein [Jiella sonneratiae]